MPPRGADSSRHPGFPVSEPNHSGREIVSSGGRSRRMEIKYRRRGTMASRTRRAEVARETLRILERGRYPGPTGQEVFIRSALDAARAGSVLYTPEGFDEVFRRRDALLRECADH